jgi:predicted ATP-binding protein involved in virulence
MEKFSELHLRNWRQFDDVTIDLSKQITILTGQNGCGKTTLLTVLSRHFGWNLHFVSTPYVGRRTKRFFSDVLQGWEGDEDDTSTRNVGSVTYSDGATSFLATKAIVGAQYDLQYSNLRNVVGMHIPSHRPVATYNNVPNIPTNPASATQQYQSFQQLLIQVYGGARGDNPGKIQKQSLISLAVFGEGNSAVDPNRDMQRIFEGFQEVLRQVMPTSLGFQRLQIRMPEVVCVTSSGEFSIDAMSGGVNAIFSIAWQIFMFSHDQPNFVVTIDEPENHLHPSMQRTLLPNLAKAFPNCSIIAATHSPFVVSSFPDANVYALARNERARIVSHKLNLADVSGTPNEVLREILDVDSNLPVWVFDKISAIIAEAVGETPAERARAIMRQLEQLGIADAIVEYNQENPNAQNR